MKFKAFIFLLILFWAGDTQAATRFLFPDNPSAISTVKMLGIGHSVVAGRVDTGIDRADSLNAPHLPEGGWWGGDGPPNWVGPRWGTRNGSSADGAPGWFSRAGDFLQKNSIQSFNEGVGGSTAANWDTTGSNYIGQTFSRVAEPLPSDLNYAVIAIMYNDANAGTTAATWKAQVGRVVDYLKNTKGINVILVKDWFAPGQAAKYNEYGQAVDELIVQYALPPALDFRTISEADWNGSKSLYHSDNTHPNTNGHIALAKIFKDYLVGNGIAQAGNCPALDEVGVDDGNNSHLDLSTTDTTCTMEDLPAGSYNIVRVGVTVIAKNMPSTTPNVLPGVQIGGTTYNCTRFMGYSGTEPFAKYGCDWEVSPASGTPWTISEINSAILAVKESVSDVSATQIYAVVETDEGTAHTGTITPVSFVKYGNSATGAGHSWWTSTNTDGLSPAGSTGEATWLWERNGQNMDEGWFLGNFYINSDCAAGSANTFAIAMRYQPGGDRYEVQVSCPATTNRAAVKLVRYNNGAATTLVNDTEVAGSIIKGKFALLVKVSGVVDPTFTVSLAADTNNTLHSDILTYTDVSALAIEKAGRWGFRFKEDATGIFGWVWAYPLSEIYGIKVTGLPAGYSIRLKNHWGVPLSTVAVSNGEAVIPWQGWIADRYMSDTPTGASVASMVTTIIGTLEVLNGSGSTVASTGLLTSLGYGQIWSFNANKKLFDYRLGGIEDSSLFPGKRKAYLWYQMDRPGTVSLSCTPSCPDVSPRYSYANNLAFAQNEYVNVLVVDNLEPHTNVAYAIIVDGTSEGSGMFRSGPLNSEDVNVKMCYSSCIDVRGAPFDIADAIAQDRECEVFVLQGDTPYVDDPPELLLPESDGKTYSRSKLGNFYDVAAQYRSYRTDPYWRNLFRSMPVFFMLNDHEYCNDYSQASVDQLDLFEGIPNFATQCMGWPVEASKKVYTLYSHYSNPESTTPGKFWFKFNWGKTAHYFPDNLAERVQHSLSEDFRYYYGQNASQGDPVTLINPSFESNIGSEWTCSGCARSAGPPTPHAGLYAAYGIGMGSEKMITQQFTVSANKPYIATAWVHDNSALSGATLRVRSSTIVLCTTADTVGNINMWTKLSCNIPDTNTATALYVDVIYSEADTTFFIDDFAVTPTATYSPEVQPLCSRDASTLSRLNCSAANFTGESPGFNVGNGLSMVLFDGKYYRVSTIVDFDTLEMSENISCTTCSNLTTRIWKQIKTSHGAEQYKWLFNSWRNETSSLPVIWTGYNLFGSRWSSGIYRMPISNNGAGPPYPLMGQYCQNGRECGFGYEHDLVMSELELLSTSGQGKKVLIPTGDEHNVRLSKWSTYDIYELLVSGLGAFNGSEKHSAPTMKEADYPGLSVILDAGGQSNWGLISMDSAAKTWSLEVRDDKNSPQAWWDGNRMAIGSKAWASAPRGLDYTATDWKYPEYGYSTSDNNFARMSSGYCWKIGTNYDTSSNKVVLRRSADVNCQDWLSANAYKYELDTTGSITYVGQSMRLANDGSSLIVSFTPDGGSNKVRKCTLAGTPPTVSSCSSPTGDPALGNLGHVFLDNAGRVYHTSKNAPNNYTLYIANSTAANSIELGTPYAVSDDTNTTNPHAGKVVLINSANDLMAAWFTPGGEEAIRARRCIAGANGYCEAGEWGTTATLITDTLTPYVTPPKEFPDIASRKDGTAIVTYITKASTGTDERSKLMYVYYNGTSWGVPSEIPNAGWYLKDAKVFYGGGDYFIAAIDESNDRIVLFQSKDGEVWGAAATPFESSLGKMRLQVSQIDADSVAVTYLSATDANSYIESNEYSVWGQSATQIWTYTNGKWRSNSVNPHINNGFNRSVN